MIADEEVAHDVKCLVLNSDYTLLQDFFNDINSFSFSHFFFLLCKSKFKTFMQTKTKENKVSQSKTKDLFLKLILFFFFPLLSA